MRWRKQGEITEHAFLVKKASTSRQLDNSPQLYDENAHAQCNDENAHRRLHDVIGLSAKQKFATSGVIMPGSESIDGVKYKSNKYRAIFFVACTHTHTIAHIYTHKSAPNASESIRTV